MLLNIGFVIKWSIRSDVKVYWSVVDKREPHIYSYYVSCQYCSLLSSFCYEDLYLKQLRH